MDTDIILLNKNGTRLPVVVDHHVWEVIKKINKTWYINNDNNVYCLHKKGGVTKNIFMHELAMRLSDKYKSDKKKISHINGIHFDNRIDNLEYYDDYIKTKKLSRCKKRRTIELSKSNIDINKIPTFTWYMKSDKTHGERFFIDIPNSIKWKSSSSKFLSLRYKLEESKKYLRLLREYRPVIFDIYSMNGDLTKDGIKKLTEYREIINKVDYDLPINNDNTHKLLVEDLRDLSDSEIERLNNFNPFI